MNNHLSFIVGRRGHNKPMAISAIV